MKKILTMSSLTLIIIFFMNFSNSAHAVDTGIGINSYYSYWEPAHLGNYQNLKVEPVFLVGPSLVITFYERYTIGAQALFNTYQPQIEYSIKDVVTPDVEVETTYDRKEIELSLMYSINDKLRVFGGFKLISYEVKGGKDSISLPAGYTNDINYWDNEMWLYGPGAGISYSWFFNRGLSATLSTAFLYFKLESQQYILTENGMVIGEERVTYEYNGIGNNTSLVFSYYIPSIDSSISIGGRCQYLKYFNQSESPEIGSDLNYGITLSVMYYF